MTGAMQGSTHSLPTKTRTRRRRQQRAVARFAPLRRYRSHAGEFAAIDQEFAYHFFLAMQEVCTSTRSAMLQRLTLEKQAALARVQLISAAQASADRVSRDSARDLRRVYRAATAECSSHMRTVCPRRPRAQRTTQIVRIKPTR